MEICRKERKFTSKLRRRERKRFRNIVYWARDREIQQRKLQLSFHLVEMSHAAQV